MRGVHVQVSIADPGLSRAVRNLLAVNRRFFLEPDETGQTSRHPFADNAGYWSAWARAGIVAKLLLFGPDELVRFESDNPGYFDEMRNGTKLILLLRSDELSSSMNLLRVCDGMILSDVNLDRTSEIVELALHGYFVIPHHLMFHFDLSIAPMRGTVLEQVAPTASLSPPVSGGDGAREVESRAIPDARATMSKAVRNVLNRIDGRSRANADDVSASNANGAPRSVDDVAITWAKWRRTLRDQDGRVSKAEYALMLAAFGVWAAIALESALPASVTVHCSPVGPIGVCGLPRQAAKLSSAEAKPAARQESGRQIQEGIGNTAEPIKREYSRK